MGGPYLYYAANGEKRYYVKYRLPDHSQKCKRGFKRKKDAQDYLARVTVDLHDGDYIDPNSGRIQIKTLAATYLAGKKGTVKPKYYRDLDSAWRVHVSPQWGNREVRTIRHSEIQTWVSRLSVGDEKLGAKAKSASVVIRAYDLLKQILDLAVADKLIRKNPCKDIDLPRKTRKKRTYLNPRQVIALADASGDHRTLILVLGFCGIRWGEAAGLTVGNVDVSSRRLLIRESVTRVNGEYVVGKPKTWETRDVPVPEFVMTELEKQCRGKSIDDLVFPGRAGGKYLKEQQRTGYCWYSRALAKSGVPSLTCHDLRHTAASIAISSGANVKAVQRMLGHKTAAMTLDTYADLFDSDLDSVAENMNALVTGTMSVQDGRDDDRQ